jgi:hypothetical protein
MPFKCNLQRYTAGAAAEPGAGSGGGGGVASVSDGGSDAGRSDSYEGGAVPFNQGAVPFNPGAVAFNPGAVAFNQVEQHHRSAWSDGEGRVFVGAAPDLRRGCTRSVNAVDPELESAWFQ